MIFALTTGKVRRRYLLRRESPRHGLSWASRCPNALTLKAAVLPRRAFTHSWRAPTVPGSGGCVRAPGHGHFFSTVSAPPKHIRAPAVSTSALKEWIAARKREPCSAVVHRDSLAAPVPETW